MQMRSRCCARSAHLSNYITLLHYVAPLYEGQLHVPVHRYVAVRMSNEDAVAVTAHTGRCQYHSIRSGTEGCAHVGTNVHSAVELAESPYERIPAHAKARCDDALDGHDKEGT